MEVLARVRRAACRRGWCWSATAPSAGPRSSGRDALGVSDAVAFLGRRSEFVEYLQHADAFVLPSETESFGVAALEALSCRRAGLRLPRRRAPRGGRRRGHRLPRRAARRRAPRRGRIVDVLGDPERRDAMGRAARARAVAHFAEPAAFDRYEAYFRRVLERSRARDTR